MTAVSGNIRFMRIFAEVPWRRGVKRQWCNRKHRFSGLSDASSMVTQEMRPTLLCSIIQSLVAFPLTPQNMTLNGLIEWPFYVKFSLLRTDFESQRQTKLAGPVLSVFECTLRNLSYRIVSYRIVIIYLFESYYLLIYCRVCFRMTPPLQGTSANIRINLILPETTVTRGVTCGSRVADRDPQNILSRGETTDLSQTLHCRNLNKWKPTLVFSTTLSLIAFPLTPKHVTLKGLEWSFCVKFCFAPVSLELRSLAFEAGLLLSLQ